MKDKIEILILPEAEAFLEDLPEILFSHDYCSFRESAEQFVDEMIGFIKQIPLMPHYDLTDMAKEHFCKYGSDLKYVFFKRKSSPGTTWYVFFTRMDNRYLVKYITNNHKEGSFIR